MPTKARLRLGTAIKVAREAVGLSQADAAKDAGISRVIWGLIERGHSNPRLSTLEAMAYVLHSDLYDLIKSSEL